MIDGFASRATKSSWFGMSPERSGRSGSNSRADWIRAARISFPQGSNREPVGNAKTRSLVSGLTCP